MGSYQKGVTKLQYFLRGSFVPLLFQLTKLSFLVFFNFSVVCVRYEYFGLITQIQESQTRLIWLFQD